jgi:EmrB/QacA subfamily drug resistance transporter
METTTEKSSQTPSDTPSEAPVRGRWIGLFAVLAAMIMNILDGTVVNVAAPSIQQDLGASNAQIQWTAAIYTLALAVGVLTGGRLGDLFGRRSMLLIGTAGFVGASLLCSAAWSPEALIGARVAQGLFGAVMIPQSFGLIRDLFPPQEIAKAFGALGPVIGFSTILGPVVAGTLVDADLFGTSWRMVFAINLPLGAFAFLAGYCYLPRKAGTATDRRIDLVGAPLAGGGMLLLLFPLVQGRDLGWPSWIVGMIVASLVVFAGFVAQQRNRTRRGLPPLVELSVLARRSYTSGVLFVIVFFGGIVGFSLSMGLFLQLGLAQSPLRASLTMAAWAVGAFVGSAFAAMTMVKLGRRILHLGLTVMTAGLVYTYLVTQAEGIHVGAGDLALPLLTYGIGMGMIFVPLFDIIMGEVEDHEVGSASGLLESLQQLGASLGVAALGTVFFSALDPFPTPERFVDAIGTVNLIAIGLALLGMAIGFLLPHQARPQAPAGLG